MRPSPDVAIPARTATSSDTLAPLVHWIFRFAFFMEFAGHGMFGVLGGKAAWVPYFGVVGIGEATAWKLMPLIGYVDVTVGILALFRPMRALLLYGAVWGLWTAMLRPLAGQGIWELLERAGNYGIPLAFLLWSGWPSRPSQWFARISSREHAANARAIVEPLVRVSLAVLLIGHGGFGVIQNKPMLAQQWATVGVHGLGSMPIVPAAGWLDIALAVAVLVVPSMWLLAFTAVWKVSCELLYPISGSPIWEFVERGGSYAAPLLLMTLLAMKRAPKPAPAVEIPAESAPA
ncbi:MAG TPA: hypothetical protein VGQ14_03240 [Candidatus Eisenbacteria bacterium]|jgi:hypothetical protein|nr:hypothetical protein [Candidatus Eisenbacteria bacterium]